MSGFFECRFSSLARNGNLVSLLISDAILVSAMPMLVILGGLSGLMLAPTTALCHVARIPSNAGLAAGGCAIFAVDGGKSDASRGSSVGRGVTILGALLGTWALVSGSFALICVAHLVLGIGLTSHQYFRFAAAEVVTMEWRPSRDFSHADIRFGRFFRSSADIHLPQKMHWPPFRWQGGYSAIVLLSFVGYRAFAFLAHSCPAKSCTSRVQPRGSPRLLSFAKGPVRKACDHRRDISRCDDLHDGADHPCDDRVWGFTEAVAG